MRTWSRQAIAIAIITAATSGICVADDDRARDPLPRDDPAAAARGPDAARPGAGDEAAERHSGSTDPGVGPEDEAQRRRRLFWSYILRGIGGHPYGFFKP